MWSLLLPATISEIEPIISIRPKKDGETAVCESILRSLPEWFGIEAAIVRYCRDICVMDTYVAEVEGDIAGFITLHEHNPYSVEIQVMAVRQPKHRSGIGQGLVNHAECLLRLKSVEYLTVKTLGSSKPSVQYEQTRKFYMAAGFCPIEENDLWGKQNPCLMMVKHLSCRHD
jgi:N-acetylglutamate synthase-like GNAT family acetyltransferase